MQAVRVSLDAETDRKLNQAIKAQPKMLDELMDAYKVTDRTIESLVTILSNKYRELTK